MLDPRSRESFDTFTDADADRLPSDKKKDDATVFEARCIVPAKTCIYSCVATMTSATVSVDDNRFWGRYTNG